MSELNSALDFLNEVTKESEEQNNTKEEIITQSSPFDIQLFENELHESSFKKNKTRAERPNQNITGYDICHNCIQQVLFKLRNTPIPNYSDIWLPIHMRTELGNAVHSFLQTNTKQFTETELNLKVPSIGFYGKIDYAIGDKILGEIKSVPYNEYAGIVKNQKPRDKDYLQLMTYSYIISNYLDEIKSSSVRVPKFMGLKPQLKKYTPEKIQFIYVAHDVISSAETESFTTTKKRIMDFKKTLNSKNNPFFFITTLLIDLSDEQKEKTYTWISDKFDAIHKYMKENSNPTANSKFVTHDCFFCPYTDICTIK